MTTNSESAAAQKSVRILVAEDEALIRMDLVEMLRDAGYDVVAEAADGAQAIELAQLHKPDLAILDVKMPVLDGISAAEKIIEIAQAEIVDENTEKFDAPMFANRLQKNLKN